MIKGRSNALVTITFKDRQVSEKQLLKSILKKDMAGAQLLYDTCQSTLLKVIYCSLKDLETSQLILEKTFLHIWNNLDDFEEQDKRFMLWAAGMAKKMAKQTAGH
jgi:DNA-directed RNA polymerase specialized sigma24 family protein